MGFSVGAVIEEGSGKKKKENKKIKKRKEERFGAKRSAPAYARAGK